MRPYIPQDQMILCPICSQFVALSLEGLSQGFRICYNILRVLHKVRRVDFKELGCQTTDLMVVGATLQCREHGHVDAVFDVWDLFGILVEDHPRTGPSQGLVCCCRNDVTVLERRRMLPSCHKARDVGDVCHEQCPNLIGNGSELLEIKSAWISGESSDDHCWTEDQCVLSELIKIDQPRLRVHFVRKGLEVDRCRRNFLLGCVVAMSQMPSAWQVQAHDPSMWLQQSGVNCKVGWTS